MARGKFAPKRAPRPKKVEDATTEDKQRLHIRTTKLDYAYPFIEENGQFEEGIRGNRDASS